MVHPLEVGRLSSARDWRRPLFIIRYAGRRIGQIHLEGNLLVRGKYEFVRWRFFRDFLSRSPGEGRVA